MSFSHSASQNSIITKSTPEPMRLLTFNLPCFPTVLGNRFNTHILQQTNLERARAFVEKLRQRKNYDVIALQEIWDPAIANYLEEELKDILPYQHRGIKGDICCPPPRRVRSGLMVFSRFPIVDEKTGVFNNHMIGEETVGEKGYIALKLAVNAEQFDTVIVTHLHADGDFYLNLSIWMCGDADYRRGVQMEKIHNGSDKWATEIPQENLKHRHTFLMGDINTSVGCNKIDDIVDNSAWLGIQEVGKQKLCMKNPGQFALLHNYDPMIPENFVASTVAEESKTTSSFSGTCKISHNKTEFTPHLLDCIAQRLDGDKMGQLTTRIVSFDDKFAVSDHLAIEAELDMSREFVPRKTVYDPSKFSQPQKVANRSGGLWHRAVSYEFEIDDVQKRCEHTIR